MYVIYPGERGNKPDEIYLSTEFYGKEKPGTAFVELKAKVLYGGDSGNIIDQYIIFCRVFDEQVKLHGRTRKAIEETIRICRDRNVLVEYLARKEAMEVMSEVFDVEESRKIEEQELRQEILAEGEEKGENNLGKLMGILRKLGRENDAFRAAEDVAYRKQMYAEFGMA